MRAPFISQFFGLELPQEYGQKQGDGYHSATYDSDCLQGLDNLVAPPRSRNVLKKFFHGQFYYFPVSNINLPRDDCGKRCRTIS